jgi:hypothetical protein
MPAEDLCAQLLQHQPPSATFHISIALTGGGTYIVSDIVSA